MMTVPFLKVDEKGGNIFIGDVLIVIICLYAHSF